VSATTLHHPWYHVGEISRGIFCIAEPSHVNSFLVVGNERAALIDTGLAVSDLSACVRSLTQAPVTVVNTHYHHDHAGNNWRFADIAIHERGVDQLALGADVAECASFVAYIRDLIEASGAAIELDERYFHLFDGASRPRALPDGFDASAYAVKGTVATRQLRDGDGIELGGRDLRVIHTPGHTPDSICLLDSETGTLFGGDTVNTGPVYAQGEDSDVEEFRRSCRRLAGMAGEVSRVGVAHFGRAVIDAGILREHADGFDAVIDGSASWRLGHDYESPVAEAMFDRFAIFVPLTSAYVPRDLDRA
jgi:glyoxylase-like metal-dependent hydrolase (beta-lactamase superfamily II)